MARPRQFDDETALEAAVECFWSRGYEATSVRELAAEMGLGSASLYNAYADKRQLFAKALSHYCAMRIHPMLARMEQENRGAYAVHAFFWELIERALGDRARRGCLLVNAALEVAPHDAELRRVIVRHMSVIEQFFARNLEAARRDGDVNLAVNTTDLSRLMLATLLGLRVIARVKPDRTSMESMVRPLLANLKTPAAPLISHDIELKLQSPRSQPRRT